MNNKEIALQIALSAMNKVDFKLNELSDDPNVQLEYLIERSTNAYSFAIKELERRKDI